nr:MAG TPA: hypothetical protein [Caudoviricetes sp.]
MLLLLTQTVLEYQLLHMFYYEYKFLLDIQVFLLIH